MVLFSTRWRPTLNLFLDNCLWMPAVREGPQALSPLADCGGTDDEDEDELSLLCDNFRMLGSHFLEKMADLTFVQCSLSCQFNEKGKERWREGRLIHYSPSEGSAFLLGG